MKWKCKDTVFNFGDRTYIMGILNVTPDSFSDGGMYNEPKKAVEHAIQMVNDGADIIDIGGQSTKPNHIEITAEQEWDRLKDIIPLLKENISVPISVDTYYPYVAQKAIDSGASIINDVSGVFNEKMAEIIKRTGAGWILMHTGGGNADIIAETDDIITDVQNFFLKMIKQAENFGLDKRQLCFDMGIGFGKTNEQNLLLLNNVKALKIDTMPILTGASRKRVIGNATGIESPKNRTVGNISAHTIAICGGTDIIRVHDVYEEKKAALMTDAITRR